MTRKVLWGLMVKDWALMARQTRFMALYMLVFIGLFAFTLSGMEYLTAFFTVLLFMLSINCFAYDEQVHFEKLLAASPVPPAAAALSRYLSALAVGVIGGAGITALTFALGFLRPMIQKTADAAPPSVSSALTAYAVSTGVAVLLVSVLFPVFFRFGVNKSRLVMLLLCALPALGALLLRELLPEDALQTLAVPSWLITLAPYLAAALLIALLVGSIALSARILRRKEY